MADNNVLQSKVFQAGKKGSQLFRGLCLAALLSIMVGLSTPASAEISESDSALAQQVFKQLLAAVPTQSAIP